MKLQKLLLLAAALVAGIPSVSHAQSQLLILWDSDWAFFHPYNADPVTNAGDDLAVADPGLAPNDIVDPDFYTTWFLKTDAGEGPGDRPTGYNGPRFGDPSVAGHYDSGIGTGPIGYADMNYWISAAPEFTGNSTILTTPEPSIANGPRRAAFFRTNFVVPAGGLSQPTIRYLIDDGALLYIDGVLVARINMPDAAVDAYATYASNATNTEDVLKTLDLSVLDTSSAGDVNPTTVPNPVTFLAAGTHTMAVSVRSNAGTSSDIGFALELSASTTAACVLTANLTSATRGNGVDPVDQSDDTVSFTATVTAVNQPAASPGWTTTGAVPSPAVTGTYGTSTTYGPFPLSVLPLTIAVADRSDALCTTSLTVGVSAVPRNVGISTLGGSPVNIRTDALSPSQWVADETLLQLTQTNGGNGAGSTPFVVMTQALTLTPGAPKCVSVTIECDESSTGSNIEAEDGLKVELVTNLGTEVLTRILDLDGSGYINGEEFNRESVPAADSFINTWLLHGIIPANATSAKLVISGNNNSATETFRVRDIRFQPCVDTDGDGAYDSEEAVAGTNPNSAASVFRLTSQACVGSNFNIVVPTVAARKYQLLTSADLLVWAFDGVSVQGTGNPLTLITPCTPQKKFVRVTNFP